MFYTKWKKEDIGLVEIDVILLIQIISTHIDMYVNFNQYNILTL